MLKGIVWHFTSQAAAVLALAGVAAAPAQPAGGTQANRFTLRLHGRPLSEVARAVADGHEAKLRLEPDVAEWKVTIRYNGTTQGLVESLADTLGLASSRSTDAAGVTTYQLILPKAERDRLHNAEAARRNQTHTDREADAAIMSSELSKLLNKPGGVPDSSAIHAGAKPIIGLIGSLGADALQRISQSEATPDGLGTHHVPSYTASVSALSPAQQSIVHGFLQDRLNEMGSNPNSGNEVGLLRDGLQRFGQAKLEFWTLNTRGMQMLYLTARFPQMGWAPDFPVFVAPTAKLIAAHRKGSEHRAPGSAQAASGARSHQASPKNPLEEKPIKVDLESADYGEALLAIGDAADLNVVADYYTLSERLMAHPREAKLGEILDRVAKVFTSQWRWRGSTLMVRSTDWEPRQEREPPAAVLDHIVSLVRKNPFLSTREMALATRKLSRDQIIGLGNWHDAKRNLRGEATAMLRHYAVYSWAGSLSETQFGALLKTGLDLRALDRAQRNSLAELSQKSAAPNELRNVATIRLEEHTMTYPPAISLALRDRSNGSVADLR